MLGTRDDIEHKSGTIIEEWLSTLSDELSNKTPSDDYTIKESETNVRSIEIGEYLLPSFKLNVLDMKYLSTFKVSQGVWYGMNQSVTTINAR